MFISSPCKLLSENFLLKNRRWEKIIFALVLTAFCSPLSAQNIILRNVLLPDRDIQDEDAAVSIVISDGELELISQATDLDEEGYLIYNADSGFVFGTLEVGAAPSFLILDGDPREDFDILLDTYTHAVFAIEQGEVRRNELDVDFARTENRRASWLAYQSPPVSIPLAIRNARQWNHFDNKVTTGLFSAAMILDRQTWVSQSRGSEQQVGDLDPYSIGEMRGFRLGLVGRFNTPTPVGYTFFAAPNGYSRGFDASSDDEMTVFDYRLDFNIGKNRSISVGKQKEPISHSRLALGLSAPVADERAPVVETFLPSRNVGVVFNDSALDNRTTWALGVFNDSIEDNGSYSENTDTYVGRFSWLPHMSEDEESLVHLAAGYRHSNVKETATIATQPTFNLSPAFMVQEFLDVEETRLINFEAAYREGPLLLLGEYFRTEIDSDILDNPTVSGYYMTANYALSGETRPYNYRNGTFSTFPVSRPTSAGGWGTFEVAARYSHLDMEDGNLNQGEMDIASVGISWWLTNSFNASLYYRYITLDQGGIVGNSQGLTTRMVFVLQ